MQAPEYLTDHQVGNCVLSIKESLSQVGKKANDDVVALCTVVLKKTAPSHFKYVTGTTNVNNLLDSSVDFDNEKVKEFLFEFYNTVSGVQTLFTQLNFAIKNIMKSAQESASIDQNIQSTISDIVGQLLNIAEKTDFLPLKEHIQEQVSNDIGFLCNEKLSYNINLAECNKIVKNYLQKHACASQVIQSAPQNSNETEESTVDRCKKFISDNSALFLFLLLAGIVILGAGVALLLFTQIASWICIAMIVVGAVLTIIGMALIIAVNCCLGQSDNQDMKIFTSSNDSYDAQNEEIVRKQILGQQMQTLTDLGDCSYSNNIHIQNQHQ